MCRILYNQPGNKRECEKSGIWSIFKYLASILQIKIKVIVQWQACVLSLFSSVLLFVMLWTIAHPAPQSMEFSSQEHQSGLPFPSPGDLPDPRIQPASLISPVWQFSGSIFIMTLILKCATKYYRFIVFSKTVATVCKESTHQLLYQFKKFPIILSEFLT